jgi:long-chain acyl-CoA synthetase
VENFFESLGREMFERTVVFTPLVHISGFGAFMTPTTGAGGTMWIVRRFDPEQVLDALERSRATFCAGLPVQVNMLVSHPRAAAYDLSSLKAFLCGGDYVQAELQGRFKAVFGVQLDEVCAMTELYYCVQPLRAGERRPGSIGRPMGDVRVEIRDGTGAPLPDGEVGEMVVRSAGLSLGYWNDLQSTAAAIRDGWLHTGDLGRRDADGYYWFEGRSKDVIIRAGSNIAPGEVEDVLCAHPAVAEAGVVGAADQEVGQAVWAYVALLPGATATRAELTEWARERIAAYKVPQRIIFADALPKGLTGKIDRKVLRAQAAAEQEETRAPA